MHSTNDLPASAWPYRVSRLVRSSSTLHGASATRVVERLWITIASCLRDGGQRLAFDL